MSDYSSLNDVVTIGSFLSPEEKDRRLGQRDGRGLLEFSSTDDASVEAMLQDLEKFTVLDADEPVEPTAALPTADVVLDQDDEPRRSAFTIAVAKKAEYAAKIQASRAVARAQRSESAQQKADAKKLVTHEKKKEADRVRSAANSAARPPLLAVDIPPAIQAELEEGWIERVKALADRLANGPLPHELRHLNCAEWYADWWIVRERMRLQHPGKEPSLAKMAAERTGCDKQGRSFTKTQAQTVFRQIGKFERLAIPCWGSHDRNRSGVA